MNTSAPEVLADHLAAKLGDEPTWILGVDGKDGAGKSKLATQLSKSLSAQVISLDDFIEKHQDNYVDSLRFNELSEAIRGAHSHLIIEGVCLLAAIEHLDLKINEFIYVKRTKNDIWLDEETLSPAGSVDEILENEKRNLLLSMRWLSSQEGKEFSENEIKLPPLSEEIIRYHAKYRPSTMASYIFEAIHR
ncbi:hypothetical protein ACKI1H_00890 [Pseudomonas sp. YH-1]|uniref:hypothetical protein n=1 Tax=Pseudomonas sp. YH-1 TaxID=3384787 RepID=UPI003F7F4E27